MAAEDHLGPQFHDAPNGKRYRIDVPEGGMPWDRLLHATPEGRKHPVASISWFPADKPGSRSLSGGDGSRPEVYKAFVKEPHRRQGVATALFEAAALRAPGLQHSRALSDDGKAFVAGHMAKKYGDPT